jgi:hypothetical protein
MSSQSVIPSLHTQILCTGFPTVGGGKPLVAERRKGCRDGSSFTCAVTHPIAAAVDGGVADLTNKAVTLHQVRKKMPVFISHAWVMADHGMFLLVQVSF